MINPSLATMLCLITSDDNFKQNYMQDILQNASNESFNKISVDGDTSTNDTLMLLSTNTNSYNKEAFIFAINQVCKKLSLMILKDGEGSNKVVAFEIIGAKNDKEAQIVAKKLSNSLLVKTALFGCDPNWGRIASTIGSSGVQCKENTLSISYDNILVYKNGNYIFTKEVEEKAFKVLNKDEFRIICDLGISNGKYTSYGCDLSYEYVKINAEYRS
jgi:glutamate N-acetyltransferase/amino-acid N-acetyltransferase